MSDGKVRAEKKNKEEMAAFSKIYLLFYNGVQTAGWSYVLFQTFRILFQEKDISNIWAVCGTNLTIFQSLALMEVVHSMFGLVKANAMITFLQVFSRVFQIWGILNPVLEAQNTPAIVLTLIAWGITESVRYSYYFFNLLSTPPWIITWCRYTFFIALYPMGVLGESGNVFYALNTLRNKGLFSLALPNRLNFSFNFYYATLFLMASYIPLFPKLYLHMFSQRKKILGGSSSKPAKKLS